MALSALSLHGRAGTQNLDALQYYQETLPSLQKSLRGADDIFSDGALLTHFVLLLYEVSLSSP